MADWENILGHAKTHGDFSGRTPAEQDAYFEFFAGPEPIYRAATTAWVRNFFAHAKKARAARHLRRPAFAVVFSRSPSNN